jgi:hypothetical protein
VAQTRCYVVRRCTYWPYVALANRPGWESVQMQVCKWVLCTLGTKLLVGSKICRALITAVEVHRGVTNMGKYQWGTWSVQ